MVAATAASPTAIPARLLPGSALGRRRLSSLPATREEDEVRPSASDHVVLLVQEWLTVCRLPATLGCLVDEYARSLGQPPPATDKWFELTQQLDLGSEPLSHHALLEQIVQQTLEQSRRRRELAKSQPQPTTVVVSKRPATASAALKFASKRALPMSHSRSTTSLPSPAMRPQSAASVVVGSQSSPALTRREEQARSNNQRSPTQKSSSRPTSAAAGSLTPHRDGRSNSQKPSASSSAASPTGKRSPDSKSQAAEPRTPVDRPGTAQSSASAATKEGSAETETAPEKDEPECAIELEDMTEERLVEQFGGFSRSTIKRLRRVLAKSSAHSQELQRTKKALDRIQLKAQLKHERSNIAAKQTELLSTTMDMIIKEPCSLCRHVFLKKNLTTRVSYKSIVDLRASWGASKQRDAAATSRPESPASHDVDDDDPASGGELKLETTQQISHLYDEVPVCVFCAQLALDFPSYRPSSAEQKQRREEARRLSVEKHKRREEQRALDRLKCDPLDFHSYELNSDDDSDETEEVLAVDGNGRVQVVRRRRRRRQTSRTPAAIGLVSKRLHYDNLRSQSVHALNRKEWEVISRSLQE